MSTPTIHQRVRAIMRAAIPHQHKMILLALHDHYDHTQPNKPMRVSVERLSLMLQVSEATAYRWLSSLKKTSVIRFESKPRSGVCTRYWICWDQLTPCPKLAKHTPRKMTGVGLDPSQDEGGTDVHPSQDENPPLSDCETTPLNLRDEVAPEVAGEVATPPTPPEGAVDGSVDSVDTSIEVKPPKKPARKRRRKSLTVEGVCALPIPLDLQVVEGYAEAFQAFAAHRIEIKKPLTERAVGMLHRKMSRAYGEGLDVLGAIEQSIVSGWSGVFPSKPREHTGPGSKINTVDGDGAWRVLLEALDHWQRTPPQTSPSFWRFADTDAEEARYVEALKRTTDRGDLAAAWALLFNRTGDPVKREKLRRNFGYHWRTIGRQQRQGVAA